MALVLAQDDEAPRLDLRSGGTVWELQPPTPSVTIALERSLDTDVIVIGAGITGSFIAERLSREGRRVLVLDRHRPRAASTAASTALLQWELDAPMLELEQSVGYEAATAIYRRSFATVDGLAALVASLSPGGGLSRRETLYLAGNELDLPLLREEQRIRASAGLPGEILDAGDLSTRFGLSRSGAILSPGSAEADPVALARLMMDTAIARGTQVASPVEVIGYECGFAGVRVTTSTGLEVSGQVLVLANGYEMPTFVPATAHRLMSTWAVATVPQAREVLWPGGALIWEAADPYIYARTTAEGRIIFGGEDEPLRDAGERDAATPAKVDALRRRLHELRPDADLRIDAAWTGFFGETTDALPLIGRVPGQPRCYAAFGYGGNGITFSALAADLIAAELTGTADPIAPLFAVDRQG